MNLLKKKLKAIKLPSTNTLVTTLQKDNTTNTIATEENSNDLPVNLKDLLKIVDYSIDNYSKNTP